jgi:hypothetical protein
MGKGNVMINSIIYALAASQHNSRLRDVNELSMYYTKIVRSDVIH